MSVSNMWSDEDLQQFIVPGHCTLQEVRDMKKAFDLLDDDQSGTLDVDEFLAAVKALNVNVKLDHKKDISMEGAIKASLGDKGAVTFEEFMKRMTARLEAKDDCDEILRIFEMFDTDSTGSLSQANLLDVAQQYEPGVVSKSDIDAMIRNLNCRDNNDEIDPVDFYMALMRGVESREESDRQLANELDAEARSGYEGPHNRSYSDLGSM